MWQWLVVWQACSLVLISGTLDIKFISKPRYDPIQTNCVVYPRLHAASSYNDGWPYPKKYISPERLVASSVPGVVAAASRRIDHVSRGAALPLLHSKPTDIVKEHAKLVQDINGLRQLVYVAPFADDTRDYEDSIFHEIIETSSTTATPHLSTAKPPRTRPASSSIPIILLGGASQPLHQVVKSQPLKFPKSTISLVGTSVSPIAKHPYPFVMHSAPRKPLKVCVTSVPMLGPTRRPTLWERIVRTIIPR